MTTRIKSGLLAGTLLATLAPLLTPATAHADDAADKAADAGMLKPIIVTADAMMSPLVVETDPKNPRQPVPPNDGAGYLKAIPGFSVIRKGGIDGDPVFRGQSGSRLNVLIDGSPMLGGCGMRMDPPTAYVFPESFDKITVLKGPQSVIHGGSAPGATILIDRTTERFTSAGARATVSGLVGSWHRNDQLVDVAAGDSWGYVRAIGSRSHSGDYEDGDGRDVHSRYDRKSGTLIAGWTPDDKTTVEVSGDFSEAEAAYADRMMDGSKFDRQSYRLNVSRTDIAPFLTELSLNAYHDYVDHVMDRFTLRSWTGGMMAALSNPDRTSSGLRTRAKLAFGEQTSLVIGADYNHDRHRDRALSAAEYNAGVDYQDKARVKDMLIKTTGLFAEATRELGADSRLVGGYRLNIVKARKTNLATPLADTDHLHNLFLRYESTIGTGITGYVSIGHTQRAPDYWERNKLFTLKSEKVTQLDAGVLLDNGPWTGSLALFASRTDDYILLSSMSGKNVDASSWGGEADLGYQLSKAWSVQATAAYVRASNRDEDKPLPQIAPLEATFGVKYDDGAFVGGVLVRAVAEQNRVDIGWGNIVGVDIGKSDGFATLSANLGWRPWTDALLSVGVDNLLDKTYAEHISRASTPSLAGDGYIQTVRVNEPGRTFWVKAKASF